MAPGHGGAFPPISLPAATLTTSLTIPATATPSSPSPSSTITTRASAVLASSAATPSAATIPVANLSFTTIVATEPLTSSVKASTTITTIPPFTPVPADRLLYNGGLLAWSFITLAVVGLIVIGGVVCWNRREKDNFTIVRGVRVASGGKGGKAVGRVGDGRYCAVVVEIQEA